jgi:dolichyl-diphosphooligosaccharide---protein glycosyltransferase
VQVRIYEVKKDDPLGRDIPWMNSFNAGKRRKKSIAVKTPGSKKGKSKA